MSMETVLLYHPDNPTALRPITRPADKYRMYNSGWKKVSIKRIGNRLKSFRKKVGFNIDEMLDFLWAQGMEDNLLPSSYRYRKIEAGTASHETVSITFMSRLSTIFKIELENLYVQRQKQKPKFSAQQAHLIRDKALASIFTISGEWGEEPIKVVVIAYTRNEAINAFRSSALK